MWGRGKPAPLAHTVQGQIESPANEIITREDTKGFKNYAGVGKEEGFITVSCPASALFTYLKAVSRFYIHFLQKKNPNSLCLYYLQMGPCFLILFLLLLPFFLPPSGSVMPGTRPQSRASQAQLAPSRGAGLQPCVCTRCCEISVCLPFKHPSRAETCQACSLENHCHPFQPFPSCPNFLLFR